MREPNSCVHISVPLMSTARVWSIDSSVMSRHDICSLAMSPTLLTATSSRPKRSHTASAIRLTCAQSVMSACTTNALRPSASTRAAVCRAPVLRAAVVHGDVGALLRRAHRDLGTEAGARAGDQDSLSD